MRARAVSRLSAPSGRAVAEVVAFNEALARVERDLEALLVAAAHLPRPCSATEEDEAVMKMSIVASANDLRDIMRILTRDLQRYASKGQS